MEAAAAASADAAADEELWEDIVEGGAAAAAAASSSPPSSDDYDDEDGDDTLALGGGSDLDLDLPQEDDSDSDGSLTIEVSAPASSSSSSSSSSALPPVPSSRKRPRPRAPHPLRASLLRAHLLALLAGQEAASRVANGAALQSALRELVVMGDGARTPLPPPPMTTSHHLPRPPAPPDGPLPRSSFHLELEGDVDALRMPFGPAPVVVDAGSRAQCGGSASAAATSFTTGPLHAAHAKACSTGLAQRRYGASSAVKRTEGVAKWIGVPLLRGTLIYISSLEADLV